VSRARANLREGTEEQFEALMNGTAIMEDYIVISPDGSDGVPLGAAGGF
jgi:hypothetical protein